MLDVTKWSTRQRVGNLMPVFSIVTDTCTRIYIYRSRQMLPRTMWSPDNRHYFVIDTRMNYPLRRISSSSFSFSAGKIFTHVCRNLIACTRACRLYLNLITEPLEFFLAIWSSSRVSTRLYPVSIFRHDHFCGPVYRKEKEPFALRCDSCNARGN